MTTEKTGYNRLPEVGELYEVRGTESFGSGRGARTFWLIIDVERWIGEEFGEDRCRVTFLNDRERVSSFEGRLDNEIHFWSRNYVER